MGGVQNARRNGGGRRAGKAIARPVGHSTWCHQRWAYGRPLDLGPVDPLYEFHRFHGIAKVRLGQAVLLETIDEVAILAVEAVELVVVIAAGHRRESAPRPDRRC